MKKVQKKKAFTLIELLVVVSIIAALVGILSVAQRKVKIVSKNLQQKAMFHAAEVGLELFSKDFGDYPDSEQINRASGTICGAHRLAEAMLGRDEQGFHPRTKWHPDDDITIGLGSTLYTSATEKDRKDPYMEIRRGGVYTIYELWGGANGSSPIYDSQGATTGTQRAPVITDVFALNRAAGVEGKVGMPVLYFKADPTKDFRVNSTYGQNSGRKPSPVNLASLSSKTYMNWIYNFDDNRSLLMLPWLRDSTSDTDIPEVVSPHYTEDPDDLSTNAAGLFYKLLTQTERDTDGIPGSDFFKPYNPNTFILISAGYDGIYGTKDDVTSFDY